MDRSIKIVWELQQVFEPYRMMFKKFKGKKRSCSHRSVFAKKKNPKKYSAFFLGGGQLFKDFLFPWGEGGLDPNPTKDECYH